MGCTEGAPPSCPLGKKGHLREAAGRAQVGGKGSVISVSGCLLVTPHIRKSGFLILKGIITNKKAGILRGESLQNAVPSQQGGVIHPSQFRKLREIYNTREDFNNPHILLGCMDVINENLNFPLI